MRASYKQNTNYESKNDSSDHVYFNAIINNPSATELMLANYSQTSTVALLENPSEYYCSIIRFDVPVEEIPIFNFLDNTYSCTISFGGVDYQTFLVFVPNASPNLGTTDRSVYCYQQFIDSINNAIITSFNNFSAALPAYNGATTYSLGDIVKSSSLAYISLVGSNTGNTPASSPTKWQLIIAPYMTYDPISQLCTINASAGFYNSGYSNWNQPLKLWFNPSLWSFFSNFYKIYNGNTLTAFNSNGKNYQIIIAPILNNSITLVNSLPGYAMIQEFISISSWNSFNSIVFFTANIPVKYESIPSIQNGNSGLITSSQPIITDFQAGGDGPIRNHLQYFAPGEYRLVNMTGTTPLRTIDIQIYYQFKDGTLSPLYLFPLDTASIKIMFRKKTVKSGL